MRKGDEITPIPLPVLVRDAAALGAAIRARRNETGLSTSAAADELKVSSRFLNELERGKGTVQFDRAVSIAQAVEIELVAVPRSLANQVIELAKHLAAQST